MSGIKIHDVKEQTHLYLVFGISQGNSMLFLGPWILTTLVHDQDNQMLGRFLYCSEYLYEFPCFRLYAMIDPEKLLSGAD